MSSPRLVKIEGYELVDYWDLGQIQPADLVKKITKFKYDTDSLGYPYLGMVFQDNTYIVGMIECDGDCNDHDPNIHWLHNYNIEDGIDYKIAYDLGFIGQSEYESAIEESKRAEINQKRAQLERLKRELGE